MLHGNVTPVPDSGEVKIELPKLVPGESSRIDVIPGTKECEVLTDTTKDPDPEMAERRKHPAPLQVSVQQPSTGGLTGWPATVANMTAVAFVLLLTFMMYRDFVATTKERDSLIRDEMKLTREEMRASREADTRSNHLLTLSLQGLQTKMDSLAASNIALATEFRAARLEMKKP